MKKKILGVVLVPAAVLLGALLAPACTQPRINCLTGHGGYAVTYTLKSGSAQGGGTCGDLKAEIIGLEKFNPSKADDALTQDLDLALLAMRSNTVGAAADAVDTEKVMGVDLSKIDAIGDFDSVEPDAQDRCTVKKLSASTIAAPQIDLSVSCMADADCPAPATCATDHCVQPATSVTYDFSDVRVWVTTAYEGVVFAGTLTYTDENQGCSAQYSMLGLYPLIGCGADADCDPLADPDAGRVTGSGINPDFRDNVRCDLAFGYCVLEATPKNLE
jgi:hypothetical protein